MLGLSRFFKMFDTSIFQYSTSVKYFCLTLKILRNILHFNISSFALEFLQFTRPPLLLSYINLSIASYNISSTLTINIIILISHCHWHSCALPLFVNQSPTASPFDSWPKIGQNVVAEFDSHMINSYEFRSVGPDASSAWLSPFANR